jgi:RsiW-degrading membrane proteinase PrsW (M82 family)
MYTFLLVLALFPSIALLVYVYRKDRVEREPVGLVLGAFLLGVAACIPAAFVESMFFDAFGSGEGASFTVILLENFIGVAVVEEGVKMLALLWVRRRPAFNYLFDGIVYGAAVGLGFAAFENVFYVLDGGAGVALTRALTAVPGHCADGIIMGFFLALGKMHTARGRRPSARRYNALAFVIPVIEHGFYDAALTYSSDLLAGLAFLMELVFIVIAFVIVHRISKRDEPLRAFVPPPPGYYRDLR